jgi:hypothetical protein
MWTTMLGYYSARLKWAAGAADGPARPPVAGRVALATLVIVAVVGLTGCRAVSWISGGRLGGAPAAKSSPGKNSSSSLYECELSYLQMDLSLIKFEINYLEFDKPRRPPAGDDHQDRDDGDKENDDDDPPDSFRLARIEYNSTIDQLRRATKLDAKLPFVFFINGFNTFAPCKLGRPCEWRARRQSLRALVT